MLRLMTDEYLLQAIWLEDAHACCAISVLALRCGWLITYKIAWVWSKGKQREFAVLRRQREVNNNEIEFSRRIKNLDNFDWNHV